MTRDSPADEGWEAWLATSCEATFTVRGPAAHASCPVLEKRDIDAVPHMDRRRSGAIALGFAVRDVCVETSIRRTVLMELAVEAVALVVVAGFAVFKAVLADWEREMRRRDACY